MAVTGTDQVGEARRLAVTLARRSGFDELACGKVALVVTETATNLVKHAAGGEILLQPLEQDGALGLEVLALDRGPGMMDLDRCLRDGVSSTGSPGTGLGAIARLADIFDVYTLPQKGTALLARLWSGVRAPISGTGTLETGVVHLPKAGEEVCGDGWGVEQHDGRSLVLVTDGLGHGLGAAEAAREAGRIFRANLRLGPVAMIQTIHAALRSTRGAAVAVVEIDSPTQTLRFAGVGNICGTIFAAGASRSTVSHNGTVGHEVRKVQEFSYPFPPDALLVLHSDGMSSHWRLEQYPGLALRHPAMVAGVLFRDFKRGRDDVTVVVLREARQDHP